MARAKRRKPYDPASAKIHDRRATQFHRQAQVTPVEVDDPMGLEPGDKIIVMRSTRDDPLGDLHVRKMIDEAQCKAGRMFQQDFEAAERGPRAIDPGKEAVDGGMMPEPITERQRRAARRLGIIYKALGQDGSAIVHDVLIYNKTRAKVAESRGLAGKRWEEYFGMRFRECLDCMAIQYGLAMQKR